MLRFRKQKKPGAIVGLDIEAGSIAATEVRSNGTAQLSASAIGPLPPAAFAAGEVMDGDGLSAALKSFFADHKLGKNVRLGVGNQGVVVRTVRLPAIEDPAQMDAAVRFKAQEAIPMPLDQAVLEHQVVGGVPAEEGSTPQLDVVVVAARRDMVSSFVEPLRRAGLELVGIDLSAFAMIRALASENRGAGGEIEGQGENGEPQRAETAILYCNVGGVTNLAVAKGRNCLFTRVADVGLEPISMRLAATRGLRPEDAAQWLNHVGLEEPTAQIEGDEEIVAQARRLLQEGVATLVDELRLSLDYYAAQESAVPVEEIVLCGAGSVVPGLADEMDGLGFPVSVAHPAALAGLDDPAAARLTLPYGLALEI